MIMSKPTRISVILKYVLNIHAQSLLSHNNKKS